MALIISIYDLAPQVTIACPYCKKGTTTMLGLEQDERITDERLGPAGWQGWRKCKVCRKKFLATYGDGWKAVVSYRKDEIPKGRLIDATTHIPLPRV